jgi:signal transduction histidine kinase
MLQIVTEAIVRNMDVAFARVWTLDASGKMLLLRASAGMYTHLNGFHSRVPIGKHKIGRIAKDRTPHVTNDVVNDPWISDPEWARREHFVSFAGYPLVVGGDLVGVLAVFGREHLSDTAIEALGSAARSVAVGIQRRKLEEQYRQSQKMEAIGQLAGGVAHDFNNLLSVILGYTQILLGREDLPESVPPRLEQIKRAGERAAALTRQLLAFGRRQIMEPRVLDLNAVLRDLDPMLHRLISENIKLEIRTDPDLARTKADPSQLEQVIVNLAVNARDAMPEGGELVISTSNAEVDRERAAIQTEPKEGAYVRLVVSDSGMGMTPDVRQRIFEPFFTTKERGKGTGLGLATVYGIVQQSGGYISVYSEPGIGTTFRVDLPATREKKAVRRPARGGASRRAPEGTETVLLVEDEAAVRSVARDALADLGYTVLEAGDGVEALQTSEAYPDPIHLVVTDVIMPRMNGSRLVEEITKQRPGIRHLFVSGYADDEVFRHRILPSGTPFLAKPFTPGSLGSKVRSVLDSPAREETEPQAE